MSRLPALGIARTLVALIFLAAVIGVSAYSIGLLGSAPGGANPSPTDFSATPTPGDNPTLSPTPASATSSPSPDITGVPSPSGDVVAYQNPDGISPDGFAGDDYPFIEQARALPTFAGLWADENQRDFHVAVTGDVEGAIAALKDGIPRGITVFFHLAQYTEAEICAIRDAMFEDRDELMAHGIVLTYGGCGNREMRVQVGISPLTPESVAYMETRYAGPVDYEDGGWSALRPYDPPEGLDVRLTAVRDGDDWGQLTCGRRPFAQTALDLRPVGIDGSGPESAALRESLDIYIDLYGDLSSLPWILAERDDYGATFLARQGDRWLEAPVFAGTGGWVPGTIDDCTPRTFTTADFEMAEWTLDPAFPSPTAASTEIHVLVTETACASGSLPADRLVPPLVRYLPDELLIEVGVRPMGPADCPSNPSQPVTIVLPEPIGDRTLDGGSPGVP